MPHTYSIVIRYSSHDSKYTNACIIFLCVQFECKSGEWSGLDSVPEEEIAVVTITPTQCPIADTATETCPLQK